MTCAIRGSWSRCKGRWRELHARGQKLLRQGTPADQIPAFLRLSLERWAEIAAACSVRVVAMGVGQGEELVGRGVFERI